MRVILLFVIATSIMSVVAQTSTSDPEARDREVFRAYGYCFGQQKSIDQIKRDFPQLRVSMSQAEAAFNVTFGKSCTAIGDKFGEAIRLKLNEEFNRYITGAPMSEAVAREFVAKIEARAKGDIETPVKETLLTFNPDFQEQPALEFMRGFTRPFSTEGHSKAKGLTVEIKVPMSWMSREGNRPNIVQFFKAEYGRSDASMLIEIREIIPPKGKKVTQRDLDAMFTPTNLKVFVPEGGVVLESKPIILEGQRGGMLVYDVTAGRLDLTLTMRTLSYMVFYKNRLISIQFSVGGLMQDRTKLIAQFVKTRPLFNMIANSMIIRDAYTGN
ncbi:MAG: hypothetical protein KF881_00595 [Acidobacteria bacterium]|nr:hypothetical protein [Acidobacteriota bacterium]